MAISATTLVVTVGGTSSNSYVTLQQFADYRDLYRINADAFDGATADDKVRALLMAARRLDRENWRGAKADSSQALAWPRYDVPKRDGSLVGGDTIPGAGALLGPRGGYGVYVGGSWGEMWETDAIPQPIKDAQCELAIAYLEGFETAEGQSIAEWSADGVSIKYGSAANRGDALPPIVSQLISGLIQGPRLARA